MEENKINEIKIDKNVLKSFIIEWLTLDDQIKTYRETIKELSDEKNQYEKQIIDLMNLLNQDKIITEKGNIEKNIRKSKSQLTPEIIKVTLSDILKNSEIADIYTNKILDKRQIKETMILKKVKNIINKKINL